MEVGGVNTLNIQKEGYSRQVVNAAATPGLSGQGNLSLFGTGVEITSIQRMRDAILDARMRRSTVSQAYWATMELGTFRIDGFIIGSDNKSLNNYLDTFWESLEVVSKQPDNQAIRSAFLQETDSLTLFTKSLYNSYNSYRDELNQDVKSMVQEVNSILDQITVLNKAIRSVNLIGGEPNDLLDKRDLLVDQLCMLTGAEAGTSGDEADGDYKVYLNGITLIQGENAKHLVLVENPANKNYYEVQIEYNQYDITSDSDVAGFIIERTAGGTSDLKHEMDVKRMADEMYWTIGYGRGQSSGGARMDGILDPNGSLNMDGSFALQVGSKGIRAFSQTFDDNPPGIGVVKGEPAPGERTNYSFRISAGGFETTVEMNWNGTEWDVSDNLGNSFTTSGGNLTVESLGKFMNDNYSPLGIDVKFADNTLVLESEDRHMMSITDISGDIMQSCGLANDNPIVKIDVTSEDSLQTIANKINNAYMFDRTFEVDENGEKTPMGNLKYETNPPGVAPSTPDQWVHASVEVDENGGYYLMITSNVAGETNRINVMPGAVCDGSSEDMSVARLLGLVDDSSAGQSDVTSYIQRDESTGAITNRDDPYGDVYVDDAWVVLDGNEFLSSGNEFKEARQVLSVGNAEADKLAEFSSGIRVTLNGVGHTTILVRNPLSEGLIFAHLKLRDDVLLSQMDVFDDMVYKLSSEFNAIHYAGYGSGDYADVTGMEFFGVIKNQYGAFGKLTMDSAISFDESRFASATGDGNGFSLGTGDGANALSMAMLKQEKLFMKGTASFDDLYKSMVADIESFKALSETSLAAEDYIAEQIDIRRQSVMGVDTNEEMLSIVEMNKGFNSTSQYLSTLLQVIDTIITGVGRVGI
jgi:flagellar hook-associated protein 1 FlgK